MSLTNGTKDYWASYFKERIARKVAAIREANLAAHNALEAQAREHAATRLGLTRLLADFEAASAEYKRLDDLRDAANRARSEVSAAIYKKLYGKEPNGYYNLDASWKGAIEKETGVELQDLLARTDWGQEMARLLKQADSIEVQIMLSTSPKELVSFVQAKLSELGMEIE